MNTNDFIRVSSLKIVQFSNKGETSKIFSLWSENVVD